MKLKEVFGNMGFGFGFFNNPSCQMCKHFSDMKCNIANKVIKEHGKDNLEKWVEKFEDHNKCSYFKNKTKQ